MWQKKANRKALLTFDLRERSLKLGYESFGNLALAPLYCKRDTFADRKQDPFC